ncbi:hypothetical protein [Acetobacterium sp. KB-1]|uniref:hypothetical protein n=1 Tax=Acetobacterium sp. KB-1 TaxID=2184575 RepID=UPI0019551712|nr:hypothetical protein [Acetobacterium sp. KB-1]
MTFIEKDGYMVIANSAMLALEKAYGACVNTAERLDLKSEEDVLKLLKRFRKRWRSAK